MMSGPGADSRPPLRENRLVAAAKNLGPEWSLEAAARTVPLQRLGLL
jgi:hypothetical protein